MSGSFCSAPARVKTSAASTGSNPQAHGGEHLVDHLEHGPPPQLAHCHRAGQEAHCLCYDCVFLVAQRLQTRSCQLASCFTECCLPNARRMNTELLGSEALPSSCLHAAAESTCRQQGSRKSSMPALPAAAARQGMWRKKAARSCQSLELRKVIIVGSRKSLLALHYSRLCMRDQARRVCSSASSRKHAVAQLPLHPRKGCKRAGASDYCSPGAKQSSQQGQAGQQGTRSPWAVGAGQDVGHHPAHSALQGRELRLTLHLHTSWGSQEARQHSQARQALSLLVEQT